MSLRVASLDELGRGAWRVSKQSPFDPSKAINSLPLAEAKCTNSTQEIAGKDGGQKAKQRKPRKNEIEGEEQAALIKEFRALFPSVGDLLIHIPNGGSRKNAFEGWRLKEQGVRAGVSDLLLPHARGGFFGLWIEFKAAPPHNSPVSEDQKQWIALMLGQGYHAEVCAGIPSAIAALRSYMALPVTNRIQTSSQDRPK